MKWRYLLTPRRMQTAVIAMDLHLIRSSKFEIATSRLELLITALQVHSDNSGSASLLQTADVGDCHNPVSVVRKKS